jgi:REP element-mobilizing transposase RayT
LNHPPVRLGGLQRLLVREALIEKLRSDGVEIIALAVSSQHFHLLARFPALDPATRQTHRASILQDGRDPSPRHFLGRARRHASFTLSEAGVKPAGPVWAARPKCQPIRDRGHQVNVARYIEKHQGEGAAVWMIHRGFL